MAKPKLIYISHEDFSARVKALDVPESSLVNDVYRTAGVLQYVGESCYMPSFTNEIAKRAFDEIILRAVERADWSLYTDNFVYIPSQMFNYMAQCVLHNDPFVEDMRKTRFAKLSAVAYALVVDVHPDRKKNLRTRIELWAGHDIDEQAPTMLGALFDAWSRHEAATFLGSYGALLQALDPQASRSALVVDNLLLQMEGHKPIVNESIPFNFE